MPRLRQAQPIQSPLQTLAGKYIAARYNLLLIVIFTLINLILLVIPSASESYFLFSASVPYILTLLGMFLCGRMPEDYYFSEEGEELLHTFLPQGFFWTAFVISLMIVALYALLCFLSREHRVGALIAALVLFAIDTVLFLFWYGIALEMLLDILFHGWVLVILVQGIMAHFKAKAMPPETATPVSVEEAVEESAAAALPDSPIIRRADTEAKARVLAQTTLYGHSVLYRRVGRINELIVDGNVYAEYTARIEGRHIMRATYDGHTFEAGYDGSCCMLGVDGQLVLRCIRGL